MQLESNKSQQIGYLFMSTFCLVYILLFCWLGVYAWPQADDIGFFNQPSDLWQVLKTHYMFSNGRIFYCILIYFLSRLPFEKFYALYPALTIILYFGSVLFCANTVLKKSDVLKKFSLSLLITAVTLAALPAHEELIYCFCCTPFFWAASFFIISFTFAIKALNGSRIAFWFCILMLIINGLLLEQPSMFQGAVAFFAALLFLLDGDKKSAKICGIFWLVSIAVFLVMALAPGTFVRVRHDNPLANASSLSQIIRGPMIGFSFGLTWALRFLLKPVVYIFLLFLPEIVEKFSQINNFTAKHLKAWHIFLTIIAISVFMQSFGGWAIGQELPARAGSLTMWMMGAVWFFMWAFLYRNEKVISRIRSLRIFKLRWILVFVYIILSTNSIYLIKDLKTAPIYSAENAERIKIALEQDQNGVENIIVPAIKIRPKLLYFTDLSFNSLNGHNQSYAYYYGIKNISIIPESIYGNEDAVAKWLNGDFTVVNFDQENNPLVLRLIGHMFDAKTPLNDSSLALTNVRDNKAAMSLYRKAALMGDNQSNRSLARLYFTDKENKNYLQGIYWLSRYILGLIFPF